MDQCVDKSIELLIKHEGATLAADSEPTSESPVYNVDSPENHSAASVLNPSACCHSDSVLSDWRGWTSGLRPEKNS